MDLCAHVAAWALKNNECTTPPTFTQHCTLVTVIGNIRVYDAGIFSVVPHRRYIITEIDKEETIRRHATVAQYGGHMYLLDRLPDPHKIARINQILPRGQPQHTELVTCLIKRSDSDERFGFMLGVDDIEAHVVTAIIEGGLAENNLIVGDIVTSINGKNIATLTHDEALDAIINSGLTLNMVVERRFDEHGKHQTASVVRMPPVRPTPIWPVPLDRGGEKMYAACSVVGTGTFVTLHKGQAVVIVRPITIIDREPWVTVAVLHPIFPGSASGFVRADCLSSEPTSYDIDFASAGCMLNFAPNPKYTRVSDPLTVPEPAETENMLFIGYTFKSNTDKIPYYGYTTRSFNNFGVVGHAVDTGAIMPMDTVTNIAPNGETATVTASCHRGLRWGEDDSHESCINRLKALSMHLNRKPGAANEKKTTDALIAYLQTHPEDLSLQNARVLTNDRITQASHTTGYDKYRENPDQVPITLTQTGLRYSYDFIVSPAPTRTNRMNKILTGKIDNCEIEYVIDSIDGFNLDELTDVYDYISSRPSVHVVLQCPTLCENLDPNQCLVGAHGQNSMACRLHYLPPLEETIRVPHVQVKSGLMLPSVYTKDSTDDNRIDVYFSENSYGSAEHVSSDSTATYLHGYTPHINYLSNTDFFDSVNDKYNQLQRFDFSMVPTNIGIDVRTSVQRGDAYWNAGLWAGDIITKYDSTNENTLHVFRYTLQPRNLKFRYGIAIKNGMHDGKPVEWLNGDYLPPAIDVTFDPQVQVAFSYLHIPVGPPGALLAKNQQSYGGTILTGPFTGRTVLSRTKKWLYLNTAAFVSPEPTRTHVNEPPPPLLAPPNKVSIQPSEVVPVVPASEIPPASIRFPERSASPPIIVVPKSTTPSTGISLAGQPVKESDFTANEISKAQWGMGNGALVGARTRSFGTVRENEVLDFVESEANDGKPTTEIPIINPIYTPQKKRRRGSQGWVFEAGAEYSTEEFEQVSKMSESSRALIEPGSFCSRVLDAVKEKKKSAQIRNAGRAGKLPLVTPIPYATDISSPIPIISGNIIQENPKNIKPSTEPGKEPAMPPTAKSRTPTPITIVPLTSDGTDDKTVTIPSIAPTISRSDGGGDVDTPSPDKKAPDGLNSFWDSPPEINRPQFWGAMAQYYLTYGAMVLSKTGEKHKELAEEQFIWHKNDWEKRSHAEEWTQLTTKLDNIFSAVAKDNTEKKRCVAFESSSDWENFFQIQRCVHREWVFGRFRRGR